MKAKISLHRLQMLRKTMCDDIVTFAKCPLCKADKHNKCVSKFGVYLRYPHVKRVRIYAQTQNDANIKTR